MKDKLKELVKDFFHAWYFYGPSETTAQMQNRLFEYGLTPEERHKIIEEEKNKC